MSVLKSAASDRSRHFLGRAKAPPPPPSSASPSGQPATLRVGSRSQALGLRGRRLADGAGDRPAPPGASLLVEREDSERVGLDQAEAELAEMTRVVGDLQARRARIRQALTRLRATVVV